MNGNGAPDVGSLEWCDAVFYLNFALYDAFVSLRCVCLTEMYLCTIFSVFVKSQSLSIPEVTFLKSVSCPESWTPLLYIFIIKYDLRAPITSNLICSADTLPSGRVLHVKLERYNLKAFMMHV